MSITKIVITGGPCSGKTTGMSYLREKLSNLGYRVFVVPETATEIIMCGFNPKIADDGEKLRFEERIMRSQLFHEDITLEFAQEVSDRGKKVVILYDRGTMDTRAYMSDSDYRTILQQLSENTTNLRDKRYDAVIHMTTAANGAAAFYTLANNQARLESDIDAAIASCDRTKEAWVGHPHLRVIDNSTDFEGKIRRVYQEICHVLGLPVPLEKERKFLVSGFTFPNSLSFQTIDIEQLYLISNKQDTEERVRRRGQDNSFAYYRTHKTSTDRPDTRQEIEYQIEVNEYTSAVNYQTDPSRHPINKKRHCFLWNNIYFELDEIIYPTKHKGLILLEVELTDENENLEIPNFIKIEREVTGDKKYSNFNLALNRKI